MENLYLIVGLGNPGADYARTRHNAGFLVADRLAERWRAGWTYEKKFSARLASVQRNEPPGAPVRAADVHEFERRSGRGGGGVLSGAARCGCWWWWTMRICRLGELRLRPGGSSGGHHGLESIEQHLGTREYARLRIGIGRQSGAREITGYVLGRFSSTEAALADRVLTVASDQAETWLEAGIQKAMSQFNGVVRRLRE